MTRNADRAARRFTDGSQRLQILRGKAATEEGRQLGVSFLGSAVLQLLGVITGTLLARGLGPTDRGAFAAMVLWPTIMVTLGDLGLAHSFGYFTARGGVSMRRMLQVAYRAAAVQSLYLVPATLLVAWFGLKAADADPLAAGLILAAAFVPASLLSRYIAAVFQGQLMLWTFYAVRISVPLVTAIVLPVTLIFSKLTVWNAVLVYLAALAVLVAVSLGLSRFVAGNYDPAPDDATALPLDKRGFVKFGLRALPGTLYPVDNLFLDQLLVGLFLGPRDLGLYVSALAFTSLPRLAAYAVAVNAMPTVAKNPRTHQRAATIRFVSLTLIILLPIGILLVASMPIVLPAIFGHAFSGAVEPARFLVLGSVAFGVRQVLGQCVRGAGRPGVVSVIETAGWPLIVVAAASGPAIGLTGVTIGLLVVQGLSLVALAAITLKSSGGRPHRKPFGASR